MKIQNKIALIFTALSAGIIVALSVFVYFFASESIATSFFHRLEVRSDIVGHAALQENKSLTSIYYDIKERHLGSLPYEKHRILPGQPDEATKKRLALPSSFYEPAQNNIPARFFNHDTSYVVLRVARDNRHVMVVSSALDTYGMQEMNNLKNLLLIGFFIAMVFVFTFGKLFSNEIFKPIRRIIRNVKGINAHNLHQRLVVEPTDDDVEALSRTFNDMLDRLEVTFEMQNNFVSNASHEFRTPLTVVSGEAELGMSIPGLSDAAKESFLNIYKEVEKLEHLTNSMLSLAQTGFDGKKEQWEEVRIDELILSVKEAADRIIPENQVAIDFDNLPDDEGKLTVNGNLALLKAAFSNIVLNSCKYSDNKPVTVKISADSKYVIVEITDQGIGIPDREIGQIFVPFFRASNTARYKGYGIGLPLTHNIIRMHQGKADVQSRVGEGTRFTTYLPFKYF
ncbi:HAMP domain-containing sensor histidine kinase [Dyadobacter jiangsuensis]|uniref:histidine kinase n=1 Tax=Dyadobacter jiangsuensis TaxID=1591085 RepID=A0A2P8G8I1_9BACT|nr:HAMP domain-containing sensor histidine kinase [Dyadobacter jiangsuensis]PSL30283.1 signal transduction histidine kinase [Dyadobacter jiangsuensis]